MWVETKDAIPPYGRWTFIATDDGVVMAGFRSHTDAKGEHYKTAYQINNDSCDVQRTVVAWLDYPNYPGRIK